MRIEGAAGSRPLVRFVFDAGPMARVYLRDVATPNLRAIYAAFAGEIHVPDLTHAEVAATWLDRVRHGAATWGQYRRLHESFLTDVRRRVVKVWPDAMLAGAAVAVQERLTRLFMDGRRHGALVATHDAYYLGLAERLATDKMGRVVLVTLDAKLWRAARALGVEVFHANTCDLGLGRLNVGSPGRDFPEGASCKPCQAATCPSGFQVDLVELPLYLGSGTPGVVVMS
jgi:predicted nucleic acid-binding protein